MQLRCIKVVRGILAVAALIIFYVFFLVIGQLIPESLIIDNMQESYEQMSQEGLNFNFVDGTLWDGRTDSFFLNVAVTEYDGNILQRAMANAYTTGQGNAIEDLGYALNSDEEKTTYAYSRFWVGMVTIYKFLHIFMSIRGIRVLLIAITVSLLVMAVFGIRDSLGVGGVISFMISVFLGMYLPNSLSLFYATDIVTMLALMVICTKKIKNPFELSSFCWIFGIASSLQAYAGYWAFPLISLGIPLVYITSVRIKNSDRSIMIIKDNVIISVWWAVGLAGTIGIKQVIAYCLLGSQSGTDELSVRIGVDFTIRQRLTSVFEGILARLSDPMVMVVIFAVSIYMIYVLWSGRLKKPNGVSALVMIALYPVAWWFVLVDHSGHWYVPHMYGITYYAILSIVCGAVCPQEGNIKSHLKSFINYLRGKRLVGIICGIFAYALFAYLLITRINFFYDDVVSEYEPWSIEVSNLIDLADGTEVVQEIKSDGEQICITNVSAIFINPDAETQGEITVKIMQGGRTLKKAKVSLENIISGEYFDIPINAVLYPGKTYDVVYQMKSGEGVHIYIPTEDSTRAVPINEELYVDSQLTQGAIVNKYNYKTTHVATEVKISLLFIFAYVFQYFFCEGIGNIYLKFSTLRGSSER